MGHGARQERVEHETARKVGVEFRDDWPDEARVAVELYVEAMVTILPRWVRSLHLRWDATDGEHSAKVYTDTRNRWATITVCAQWLDEVEKERWDSLVHEVVHVYMDGMSDAFRMAIQQLDNDAAQKIGERWFSDAEEQAVTDLTDMVARVVPGRRGSDG